MTNHIYVTGDTHGWNQISPVDGIYHRFNTQTFSEQIDLTKEDVVIIAGDFGGVWAFDKRFTPESYQYLHNLPNYKQMPHGESPEEKAGLDWLNKKPFTTLFIPGNHENYSRLYRAYPIVDYCGGKAVWLRDNVLMLMNGYVFNICGKKIFTFGGARSHDISDGIIDPANTCYKQDWDRLSSTINTWRRQGKRFRVKEVSWWEQEMPDQIMMNRGVDNLESNNWKVDYIITHCCSTKLLRYYSDGAFEGDTLTDYLQGIQKQTEYKYWFFGHYHDNRTFKVKDTNSTELMLYEQIVQVC